MTTESNNATWLSIIKKHHEGIKQAFMVAITEPSKENIDNVKLLLDAHSIAEEAIIYPQLSKHGMDDEDLEHEQTEAKEQIHYLCNHYDDPSIKTKLRKLYKAVLEHAIVHEEHNKFKKLYQELSATKNIELGKQYLEHYNKFIK